MIGESLFKKWDIPIEACLFYGDTISIFKYIVFINFKYEQLHFRLEVNLTHGIKKLKENIEEHLNIHFDICHSLSNNSSCNFEVIYLLQLVN